MDIGNIITDDTFYVGYEGEGKTFFCFGEAKCLHIWDGYLDDILCIPFSEGDWCGFTRDYHMMQGVFASENSAVTIDVEEYLSDLLLYKNKLFDFKETKEVLHRLVFWLTKSLREGWCVCAGKDE